MIAKDLLVTLQRPRQSGAAAANLENTILSEV
jgi:hypothetical protein